MDLQPKAAGAAAAAAPTAEANGLGDKKQVGHAKEQAAADEEESEDDDEGKLQSTPVMGTQQC